MTVWTGRSQGGQEYDRVDGKMTGWTVRSI